MLLLIVLLTIAGIIASLILYARWNYGVLEALGIPVAKPHFLLGSTYNAHNELTSSVDIDRLRTYGPVYGVSDND